MKIYRECSELPLRNFIKLVTTKDLKWLVQKHGRINEVDEEMLKSIWEDILEEYNRLSGSSTSVHFLQLYANISSMSIKLTAVQGLVNELQKGHFQPYCDILVSLGFIYPFTPETLHDDLIQTIASAKTILMDLKGMEKEMEENNTSNEKDPTEQDYSDYLVQLSKHMGYMIQPRKITVSQYISIVKDYTKPAR